MKNINTGFCVFLTEFFVFQQKRGERHEAGLRRVELIAFERLEKLVPRLESEGPDRDHFRVGEELATRQVHVVTNVLVVLLNKRSVWKNIKTEKL